MLSARTLGVLAIGLIAVAANAQVTIGPGFGTFVDISGTGTAITGAGDDTSHGFVSTVGNDLFPAGAIAVQSNGHLVSGAAPGSSIYVNTAITAASNGATFGYAAANKVLCPWWDDLYASGAPNATIYWQEIFGVLYVQWQNIGHFATSSAAGGPGITFQVQIYQGGPCIPPIINMIYPDATFGGAQAANDAGASATVGYVGGTVSADNAQYSFNAVNSIPDNTALLITKSAFTLTYSSPFPGSIQINICGGSPNGQYHLFATLNAGVFPNGWFYGIDITLPELQGQIGNFPFMGPLDGSGSFQLGPLGGLPTGGLLTIYSLAFDIPPASVPTVHTQAQAFTIP